MNPSTDCLHQAKKLFSADQLPWPPLPADLEPRLQAYSEGAVFATREPVASPYDLRWYLREVLTDPSVGDYALLGFAEHGFNSHALHYFLVRRSLALFIQIPWGGAFTDAEASRAELVRLFEWAARLLPALQACEDAGRIALGERLLVLASRFVDPGWSWVTRSSETIDWQPAGGMLAAIDQSLVDRLASPAQPGVTHEPR